MVKIEKKCKICGKTFIAKSKKALYCSKECKNANYRLNYQKQDMSAICENCGKPFIKNAPAQKYCSKRCRQLVINKKQRNMHIQQRNEIFNTSDKEGYDYVVCPICHQKFKQITLIHFKTHNINSKEELDKLYPNLQLTCQKLIDGHLIGDKNPMSKSHTSDLKRKQSSPYSLEYYKVHGAKTEEEAIEQRQKFLNKLKPLRKNWVQATHLEYYTNQGYTKEEAIRLRKEKYTSNGLNWYINKYGKDEGTKKFNNRINYWKYKLYNGSQCSKISNEFFSELIKHYYNDNVYFGDHEYIISDNNRTYKLDFLDLSKKKIIEFYGDYWHLNPIVYNKDYYHKGLHLYAHEVWERDEKRIKSLKSLGYDVLIIWEYEYKKNKPYFINKALTYLTS